jgi:hypothetical protein
MCLIHSVVTPPPPPPHPQPLRLGAAKAGRNQVKYPPPPHCDRRARWPNYCTVYELPLRAKC